MLAQLYVVDGIDSLVLIARQLKMETLTLESILAKLT